MFNFRSRTSLGGYWSVVLMNGLIWIALIVFMYISTSGGASVFPAPIEISQPVIPIVILVSWPFINIIPGLAMTVRRLHDIGKSGIYYLFALIPVAGLFIMIIFLTTPTLNPRMNRFGYRRQV